jgi:hypothetical protein
MLRKSGVAKCVFLAQEAIIFKPLKLKLTDILCAWFVGLVNIQLFGTVLFIFLVVGYLKAIRLQQLIAGPQCDCI